ncbi:MAG: hypothetical protein ACLPVY_14855 [Acidimicrobiia bacterium]
MKRPSVDPAFTFALSLVLSLLLCLPTFVNMLHGTVDVTEGGIRYLVALAISWCGVHGVATLVAGYANQPRRPSPPPPPAISQPERRRDDSDQPQANAA